MILSENRYPLFGIMRSVDALERAVDGVTRGERGDRGDQPDLAEHGGIAPQPDRERAEQRGALLAAGAAGIPAAQQARQHEQRDRHAAAERAALQAEQQEMALEMAGDVAVLGADEMQHLDH